ncbi:MAG: hypothetical protein JXB60_07310 [Candidatus Cloacimonetes bacterium]|nr:hypothetical protein [Candidatus Cloacimonadota bacterium]
MYLVRNILCDYRDRTEPGELLVRKLHLPAGSLHKYIIQRKSLDARHKNRLKFNYTLVADISSQPRHPDVTTYVEPQPYIAIERKIADPHPFIIGSGPAGLFCALALVEKGLQPVIIEQGDMIDLRSRKVNKFWQEGQLDTQSNVQFGEGGAGTFSDGKLTTRSRDFYTETIYNYLIRFGAQETIRYESLPHLGTEGLHRIIKNIRNYLLKNGCEFLFNKKLENVITENQKIKQVRISGEFYSPEIVILATGNSARDVFRLLLNKTPLENKPLAVGFRIEHDQDFLNASFYGENTDFEITGPASYRLTLRYKEKGIYSFCMCPGGYVIGAATEAKTVVLNGMSYRKRHNQFGNSALVVTVDEKDYGHGTLSGVIFQQDIERRCFYPEYPFLAPVQNAADFNRHPELNYKPLSSFQPGTVTSDIAALLPTIIVKALDFALDQLEKSYPGFRRKGLILAPETRTSSPVRIIRNDQRQAESLHNLYPIGEGSGYAGGIISSAADGYKTGLIFHN